MHITAVIPCVDYADQLARSLPLWRDGCDLLTVVTSPRDVETKALCLEHCVPLHATERWWTRGAAFNKAGAMAEAIGDIPDWCLLVDADVIPPHDWRRRVIQANPEPGILYGARRHDDRGPIRDQTVCGWFMLFHGSDRNAQARPLFDDWHNASGYDSEFEQRWGREGQEWIDGLVLRHQGRHGVNWCGVGNDAALAEVRAHRRDGRHWMQERLP